MQKEEGENEDETSCAYLLNVQHILSFKRCIHIYEGKKYINAYIQLFGEMDTLLIEALDKVVYANATSGIQEPEMMRFSAINKKQKKHTFIEKSPDQ